MVHVTFMLFIEYVTFDTMVNTPWYVCNTAMRRDFEIPITKDILKSTVPNLEKCGIIIFLKQLTTIFVNNRLLDKKVK